MTGFPAISADQMREVDRAMIEEFHIELMQMMENAGRALAELAVDVFGPRRVVVLAGAGGNGGGGLVAARHLSNRGHEVRVVLDRPADRLGGVPAHQLDILTRMGVPVTDDPGPADVVVDALIGYSLVGDPTGRAADLIDWANEQSAPVLSLDTPSGLDVTTGVTARPCVTATATLTLALPKTGLLDAPEAGRLYLADISVPPLVYRRMGIDVGDLFADNQIIALSPSQHLPQQ